MTKDGFEFVQSEVTQIQTADSATELEKNFDAVVDTCLNMYGNKVRQVPEAIKDVKPTNQ
jgi:hypothetical protein